MSHRISKDRAEELYTKDQELRQMQREGKPLPRSNRRQKKHLMSVRKQKGFFKYLAARHKLHGHNKTASKFEEMAE